MRSSQEVAIGDRIRVLDTANGSGEFCRGATGIVLQVLQREWGPNLALVELDSGPLSDNCPMKQAGLATDLYPDEFEIISETTNAKT